MNLRIAKRSKDLFGQPAERKIENLFYFNVYTRKKFVGKSVYMYNDPVKSGSVAIQVTGVTPMAIRVMGTWTVLI